MKRILADTGPIVALFDRSEPAHTLVYDFIKGFRGEILTTWPVVTEVTHLLDFSVQVQVDFLTWILRGGLVIDQPGANDVESLIKMISKYSDRPMDLADASLVLLATREGLSEIITLDSDFTIYKLPGKKRFVNLLRES